MVRAIFGINHPRDFWKFWNCTRFTRAVSEFSKMHLGNLSQIALPNMWLLALIDLANKLYHIGKLLIFSLVELAQNTFTPGEKYTIAIFGITVFQILSSLTYQRLQQAEKRNGNPTLITVECITEEIRDKSISPKDLHSSYYFKTVPETMVKQWKSLWNYYVTERVNYKPNIKMKKKWHH